VGIEPGSECHSRARRTAAVLVDLAPSGWRITNGSTAGRALELIAPVKRKRRANSRHQATPGPDGTEALASELTDDIAPRWDGSRPALDDDAVTSLLLTAKQSAARPEVYLRRAPAALERGKTAIVSSRRRPDPRRRLGVPGRFGDLSPCCLPG